jgi:hypothetical protein
LSGGGKTSVWRTPDTAGADGVAPVVEALVGYRVNSRGALEPIRNRLDALRLAGEPVGRSILDRLGRRLHIVSAQGGDADFINRVRRWATGDRGARTINPFTATTIEQYVDQQLQSKYPADVTDALQFLPSNRRLREAAGLPVGGVTSSR